MAIYNIVEAYDVYEFCIDEGCPCEHKAGVCVAKGVSREDAERIASQPYPGYASEIRRAL